MRYLQSALSWFVLAITLGIMIAALVYLVHDRVTRVQAIKAQQSEISSLQQAHFRILREIRSKKVPPLPMISRTVADKYVTDVRTALAPYGLTVAYTAPLQAEYGTLLISGTVNSKVLAAAYKSIQSEPFELVSFSLDKQSGQEVHASIMLSARLEQNQ